MFFQFLHALRLPLVLFSDQTLFEQSFPYNAGEGHHSRYIPLDIPNRYLISSPVLASWMFVVEWKYLAGLPKASPHRSPTQQRMSFHQDSYMSGTFAMNTLIQPSLTLSDEEIAHKFAQFRYVREPV